MDQEWRERSEEHERIDLGMSPEFYDALKAYTATFDQMLADHMAAVTPEQCRALACPHHDGKTSV